VVDIITVVVVRILIITTTTGKKHPKSKRMRTGFDGGRLPKRRVVLVSYNLPNYYSLAIQMIRSFAETQEIERLFQFETMNISTNSIVAEPTSAIVSIRRLGHLLTQGSTAWNDKKFVRETIRNLPVFGHVLKKISSSRFKQQAVFQILANAPDIIGFSCNVWNIKDVLASVRLLKSRRPEVIIVLGGQEVTNSRISYFEKCPDVDFVISGEGELAFTSLLQCIAEDRCRPEDLPLGVTTAQSSTDMVNENTQPLADLNQIPSVYLSGRVTPDELNSSRNTGLGVLIELSRGCRFQCKFCFEAERYKHVRFFDLDRFRQEFSFLWGKGFRTFHLLDPTLCDRNSSRLLDVNRIVGEIVSTPDEANISAEAYAEFVTENLIKGMSFLRVVDIGLQSTHEPSLKISIFDSRSNIAKASPPPK